jgi:hypothetical protein
MGECARQSVQGLTWDTIMDDLIADYHRLIGEFTAKA